MAQATKSKRGGAKSKTAKSKAGSASKTARKTASKAPDPTSRAANAAVAAAHAAKGTKAAGQAVGVVAARVRKPLIIGGAAVAGVAGGLALSKRG